MRRALASLAAALMLIALVACGSQKDASSDKTASPPTGASVSLTQKDRGEGGVTVTAMWATQEHLKAEGKLARAAGRYDLAGYAVLHLRLDTHSGDLMSYELARNSSLAAQRFEAASPPATGTQKIWEFAQYEPAEAWVPLGEDAHHREGLLVFARPAGAQEVELSLKGLAGVPLRQLRWSLPE